MNQCLNQASPRAKKADAFKNIDILTQLPVLAFQLADAPLLGRDWRARACVAGTLSILLQQPAMQGAA